MLKGMGIDHLKLVSGVSQGGMQTWVWGEHFPDAMDALAPVASMPVQISGRNLMWREIVIRAILDDPDWHGGLARRRLRPREAADTVGPDRGANVRGHAIPRGFRRQVPTGPRRLPTMTNW